MKTTAQTDAERDPVETLQERGFNVLGDGSAVIVIGRRGTIPLDRPTGAKDLQNPTTARRFDSAKEAVRVLAVNQVSR